MAVFIYTFEACINAGASYNDKSSLVHPEPQCFTISYDISFSSTDAGNFEENRYLKQNSTDRPPLITERRNTCSSATLIRDAQLPP